MKSLVKETDNERYLTYTKLIYHGFLDSFCFICVHFHTFTNKILALNYLNLGVSNYSYTF